MIVQWPRRKSSCFSSCFAALLLAGTAAAQEEPTHMSESLRTSMTNVVVVGGASPVDQEITGSYEKVTPGLYGGISSGAAAGSPSVQAGPVTVNIPISILTLPGAIFGGISGKAKEEIQDFRDAMTEDLAQANNRTLINDGLALDVFRDLQRLPELESKLFAASTPIPEDSDAVLYVSIDDITIDVQKKEAILTAAASLSLESVSTGEKLYSSTIRYQDRASLEDWTENENALWHDFANFARHYLGREIAADSFARIELQHELRPLASDDVELERKNNWQGSTNSATPTLAWELKLLGDDAYGTWTDAINATNTFYDVEIYDAHRMVYEMKQISETQHTLVYELDPCQTYRWSVRPTYYIGDDIRIGEWMQHTPATGTGIDKGIVGKDAAAAPAYTQNFAALEFDCRRK
jgi:hypothetical protein